MTMKTAREQWTEVWRCAREDGGRIAWETRAGWVQIHHLACRMWEARRRGEFRRWEDGRIITPRRLPLP